MLSFYLIWATLIIGPPITLAVFIWIRWKWPQSLSPIARCCALFIALFFAFNFVKLSFWKEFANYACISAAYLAYCFLAASCLRIPPRSLRLGALFVASVPIIKGYILGTIGFLFLVWTICQASEPPKQMSSDLICSVTGWGSAASDSGHMVQLYKTWSWAPFLRREVSWASVDETINQPDVSCADVFANYTKESALPIK